MAPSAVRAIHQNNTGRSSPSPIPMSTPPIIPSAIVSSASSPSLRSKELVMIPRSATATPVGGGGGNVKVVVRVRGFLPRETERGAKCLIAMNPFTQTTKLLVPPVTDPANARAQTRKVFEEKEFTYDNSFWSHDLSDDHYAHQEDVYNALGEEFLDHNFEGYHTCIFAYGQTGSGKSYTMMGTKEQPGLIPRTCEDLFQRIEENKNPAISHSVRVSYFEVYNEHVRDLFQPKTNPPQYLKIRESPTEGPYVKDLTDIQVKSYAEILKYMRMGDASRTVASTKMNDTSSRSHAVFTIMLKQIYHDHNTDETTERIARIRLVDLAGSERAKATEATGARLREGSNINKSLTTLGRVIQALAMDPRHARLHNRAAGGIRRDVVPYRDSILTWLLKDSLGGNSKTAMIACIAPSDYDETLSTLRYADSAKRIRTNATVNQDHVSSAAKDAEIAEMKETIRQLQWTLSQQQSPTPVTPASTIHANVLAKDQVSQETHNEKIREYTKKYENMTRILEEKLAISESKIRQLTEDKESLQRHLRLVVEELTNPVRVPEPEPEPEPVPQARVEEEPEKVEEVKTPELVQDSHSEEDEGFGSASNSGSDSDSDSDSEYEDEEDEMEYQGQDPAQAEEMQQQMKALMEDLGLFRRKVRDDHMQFGISVGQ